MTQDEIKAQEPVAYLVYAKGSHKYMTLTFDTDKVPEIYKGGDVVALCAAGAQPAPEVTKDSIRAEAEKVEPFCWLYYERGEEMFAPPDGYRPDDAQPLYLAPQPAPKQEPFGYVSEHNCQGPFQFQFHKESATVYTDNCKSITPVYSTPVQAQERKPLTDEQITEVWHELRAQKEDWSDLDFARAIEAKIKEQAAPAQAGAQPTVTCQIYGHVVGACAECNTHNEVGAQPAPVPESACRVCIYLHKGECGHSHGPLNPRGDYCGGQVLTSKAKMEPVQAQERKPFCYYDPSTKQFAIDKDELPRGAVVWPVYREQP